jgi:hypothetical protein
MQPLTLEHCEMQRIILPVASDFITGSELGSEHFQRLSRPVEREGMQRGV